MEKLKKLVSLLKRVEKGTVKYTSTYEEDEQFTYVDCPDIDDIVNDLLISEDGKCNWENINAVREAGFNVYPGEIDSFGWISGCIDTKRGTIIFG